MENENLEDELKANLDELLTYANQLDKDEESAKDLVQQACLNILVSSKRYIDKNKFLSYAKLVILNIFRNEYKRAITRREYQESLMFRKTESSNPQTKLENEELRKAINKIDKKYLEPFKMHILDNAKYKDIAEEFNIPEQRVRYLIRKAKEQLKKIIDKAEYLTLLLLSFLS